MDTIRWKVEGMDCSNCALLINKYLEKQGLENIKINFASGDVSFEIPNDNNNLTKIATGINDLGYTIANPSNATNLKKKFTLSHLQRFIFCLPFTLLLMLHMIPGVHIHWLTNPLVQLTLTIPVYGIGMVFFGKSAWKSLRNKLPNMNVLISLGATAAFVYSLYGTLIGQPENFMFYETTATIFTLVFMGNLLEDYSVQSTQRELNKLAKSQKLMANMIAYDDNHYEHIFPIENTQLRVGDLVLIKSGEQIPIDCKILWGEGQVNESIITGESIPVYKSIKDTLIGGSLLADGTLKAQVTAVGNDTVLSHILQLAKQAQGEKPPVQQLADRISAVFVPVVLVIAVLTFFFNLLLLPDFTIALMRSIAVLVIACPCAMGLATPAAIAVGLGRAAKNGILFRNATSLELFKDLKQVVFDKTGTLTTGAFSIDKFEHSGVSSEEFKQIVFSLVKYSNHPISKCIAREWKMKNEIRWKKIEEIKGSGLKGEDMEKNIYEAVSYKSVTNFTTDSSHNLYVLKNNVFLGWIDVSDELRPEAKKVIDYLHSKNIKTILLSGDKLEKCQQIAQKLGIDEIFAEQSPEQKLQKITTLNLQTPTAMVGDGINDAPALAKATIGISMSDASHIAMQTSQVVLMNNGLNKLPTALGLGKHTYLTIKQNLFWAFAYNIVAIPIAALGFLTPTFSALVMGLSDVVLAINSGRLFVKKVV